jgi:SAM-dependent methyltransferase
MRGCPHCARDNRCEPALSCSEPPWEIKRCRDCDFVYLENAPTYDQLQAEFNWSDTKHHERERRRRREPRLIVLEKRLRIWRKQFLGRRDKAAEMLSRHVVSGRFLDVGCGNGRYFRRCPAGLSGFGVEIDPQAVERARPFAAATGGDVVHSDSLAGMREFERDFFDGVLMRAYLEHEIEPRAVLEGARHVLRPAGRIIVQVPNFGSWNRRVRGRRWCGFRFPDHVNYFTPRTLTRMVEAAGFEVVEFRLSNRLPVSDRMWLAAEAPRASASESHSNDRESVPEQVVVGHGDAREH